MLTPVWSVDFRDVNGTVLDITQHVAPLTERGISGLRRRLSYNSRETDFGLVSVLVWNGDGQFSRDHASFVLGSGAYAGRRVRIRFGWEMDDGTRIDPSDIFVGTLESILVDTGHKFAELKLTDALDRLKLTGPSATKANELFADQTPAAACLKMLGADYANISTEFIDVASFTDADTTESAASIILRKFRVQQGPWYDSFRICLTHGGSGVRVARDGRLTYFSYAPDTADGDPHLVFPGVARVRGSYSSQTVRNSTKALRGDGSDPGDGSAPPTAGTPTTLTKELSIASFGERWREQNRELTFMNSQTPVDLIADRDLDIESRSPGNFKLTVPFDDTTYLVDLAQRIKVTDADLGWVAKSLTVDEVDISFDGMTLNLGVIDTDLDGDPYLYVNRSGHQVDDGKLIY